MIEGERVFNVPWRGIWPEVKAADTRQQDKSRAATPTNSMAENKFFLVNSSQRGSMDWYLCQRHGITTGDGMIEIFSSIRANLVSSRFGAPILGCGRPQGKYCVLLRDNRNNFSYCALKRRQCGTRMCFISGASAASPSNLWRCMAPLSCHSPTLPTRSNSWAN